MRYALITLALLATAVPAMAGDVRCQGDGTTGSCQYCTTSNGTTVCY